MRGMPTNQSQSLQDGEIDLSMVFRQLWENKVLIFSIMLIALVLGIFFGQANPEATQIALIKSRFILAPVVKNLGLDIRAVPKQSLIKRLLFPSHAKIEVSKFVVPQHAINEQFTLVVERDNHFSLNNPAQDTILHGEVGKLATSKDGAIQLLINSIDASANTTFVLKKMSDFKIINLLKRQLKITDLGENRQNTGVLALTLVGPIPKLAADTLNAIGKTIQAKDKKKNEIEASQTLRFLQQQLPLAKEQLAGAESELNQYRSKSGKIDIKLQSEYLLTQLTEIDKQLGELRIDSIDKAQRYTEQHPLLISMNNKMRELNAERGRLEIQLKKLPASDQIAMNLLRDVKVKESLYKDLLKRIQGLKLVKAGVVSDVRILALAKLPRFSLPMKRSLIYVASLLLGFMVSLMIIFSRKLLFPLVDDPHWSERHFDLINLAIIPYSKEQFTNAGSPKGATLAFVPLIAHSNPRNLAIESLRSLRTTLQIKLSCETNNIVSILGVSPGVGKSFISANLAYLLATAGKRVVVIDTDMRRGTLHKYYNAQPVPGLSEVLTNKKSLTEVIKGTVHNNLMVIPRGTYPEDPAELLTSAYFKELLSTLSQQFDIVLIDTPPVLLVTDAVLISIHAGTNYLVMGANTHQPKEIEISIKRLSSAGITLNGTIFNFQKQVSGQNSYTHKYGAYYDDKENATQ